MTVKDLIARLEHYPPEFVVHGVLGVGQHSEGGVTGVKVHLEPPTPKAVEPVPTSSEKVAPKKVTKRG